MVTSPEVNTPHNKEHRWEAVGKRFGQLATYGAAYIMTLNSVINPIMYAYNHRKPANPELDKTVMTTIAAMGADPDLTVRCGVVGDDPISMLVSKLSDDQVEWSGKVRPYLLGVRKVPSSVLNINTEECQAIAGLGDDGTLSGDEVQAAVAITHESAHAHGTFGEADAVCISYQVAPTWLRSFGFSEQQIEAWREPVLHATADNPTSYQLKATCREGGEDDLTPDTIEAVSWLPR